MIFVRKKLEDVFTPSSFAKINFVPRRDLGRLVDRTFSVTGKQVVVFGLSGSGKTTFIRNYLDDTKRNYIITNCTKGMKISDIILDAFDALNPFFVGEKTHLTKLSATPKAEFSAILNAIGISVEHSEGTKLNRVLPPQLTVKRLIGFLGEAECLWIIDDFHKIDDSEKVVLAQIAKVFYDNATDYKSTRVVALGAVENAAELLSNDGELRNRLSEIEVPLLSDDEIGQLVRNGFRIMNVAVSHKVVSDIVRIANNQASVAHQLAFDLCFSAGVKKSRFFKFRITEDFFLRALELSAQQYSATFKKLLDQVFKQKTRRYENTKVILWALSEIRQLSVSFTELYDKIKDVYPEFPSGNLTTYLKSLQGDAMGSIVRYDSNGGKYSIQNPLLKSFLQIYFRSNQMTPEMMVSEESFESVVPMDVLYHSFAKDIEFRYTKRGEISDWLTFEHEPEEK